MSECPWHDIMRPEEFYEDLDPGIRFAVRVLHAAQINTCQSCEGGDGHAYDRPTVDLWEDVQTTGFAAFHALSVFGLPIEDVQRVWDARGGELVEPKWRITFREPLTERADDSVGFVHGYRAVPW